MARNVTVRVGHTPRWHIVVEGNTVTRYGGSRDGAERYAKWLRREKGVDARVGKHG